MKPTPLALLAAIALALLAWSGRAAAHPVGVSQGEYLYRDGKLYAGVTFARRELAEALPWLRGNGEAESVLAFEEHRDLLGRWLIERLAASIGDGPCAASFDGMRFDGDAVALALSYACPGVVDRVEIDARFVSELDRGHRHVAGVTLGDNRLEDVATRSRTQLSFDFGRGGPAARSSSIFAPLLRMGVEHILTGYDHLLFLLGLLLVGGPLRSLIGAITAFTVAHSITLALAALDVWAPSPRFVEPCIALSIAYVGVENWFVHDAKGRWRITFPFGLVHGFGFASALRDVALPRSQIPTALFGFNLGVELGQLAVVAVLLPIVLAAQKKFAWERVAMRVCTVAIALAGVVWFFARLRSSM
jgi:hydrogenase/urease accessory protein HupE